MSESTKPKRRHVVLTLEKKMEISRRSKSGEKVTDIGRSLGIPPTTIRSIVKNAPDLEKKAQLLSKHSEVQITRSQSDWMVKLERLLMNWIEDLNHRNTPITLGLIQEKALSLYESLKTEMGEEERKVTEEKPFKATRGWFHRFQKRHGIRNIKVQGEAASADTEAANRFPEELRSIIEEEGYDLRQVFNVDETGLYYKRMMSRTYISRKEKTQPGYKMAKERLTLLVGGNANGDKKLKPLLIHRSENPRALKNVVKSRLPVIWKSNRKAWMTSAVFREWFVEYFVLEMKKYCSENNLDFKILLLLDNASSHKIDFESLCPNVRVLFMPPNTSSLMQPMDQNVIANLKAHYLRRTFRKLIHETEGEGKPTVEEFWKKVDILQAIYIIERAWGEVSSRVLNAAWRKIYPSAVHSFEGFVETEQAVMKEIVEMANQLGFDEVDEDDVQELLASHETPLTNEELLELDRQDLEELQHDELEEEHEDILTPQRGLTAQGIKKAFDKIYEGLGYFLENDSFPDRARNAERNVKDSLACYREILRVKESKKKQSTLDSFFKRPREENLEEVEDDPRSPQPSTSA